MIDLLEALFEIVVDIIARIARSPQPTATPKARRHTMEQPAMNATFTILRQRLTAAGFTIEESVDRFGRLQLIADIGEDEGVAVTQIGDTFAARVYCGTFGKTVYLSGRGHVTAEEALDGWRKANAVPLALIAAITRE